MLLLLLLDPSEESLLLSPGILSASARHTRGLPSCCLPQPGEILPQPHFSVHKGSSALLVPKDPGIYSRGHLLCGAWNFFPI